MVMAVDSIPAGAVAVPRDGGRVVLAYGEVTGHAHAISDADVDMVTESGVTYLEVRAAMAALTHDEHATIQVPRGTYVVRRQREYTPEAIRNVAD